MDGRRRDRQGHCRGGHLAGKALVELDAVALDPKEVTDTLGVLLKYQDDIQKMQGSEIKAILDEIKVTTKPEKPPK